MIFISIKRRIFQVVFTLLTVAAVGMIFYNSSQTAVDSSQQSGSLLLSLQTFFASMNIPFEMTETILRKLAHFAEYAFMGTLLTAAVFSFTVKRRKTVCFALPIGAGVAVCDEFIQLFSYGRSCEVRDMVIDFSGVAFATLIFMIIVTFVLKKERGR